MEVPAEFDYYECTAPPLKKLCMMVNSKIKNNNITMNTNMEKKVENVLYHFSF